MDTPTIDVRSTVAASLAKPNVGALRRAANDGKVDEASKSFQKILATMLVKEMRRALPEGLFGSGPGSDAFESWFDEHLGNALVERDSLGLAGMVKAGVGRLQEAANENTNEV